MVKLSDTQLVILSAASQRDDRLVLPLPERIKGGAAAKVVDSLLAKGLIEEVEAKREDAVWRETDDGHRVTLVATDAAFAALGIEPHNAPTCADSAEDEGNAADHAGKVERAPTATLARKSRDGTKQAQVIAMLRAPEGATIDEIVTVTGWQPHTVRGAFAGALKKKLGLEVSSEKIEGRGRVYRLLPV
jgi:hypothetical protein